MPQRALIKRILLSAVACLSIMLFHQFQGVIIEGVRGPLPRVILDTGCLPPPRRGDDKIALVASYFVPPAQPTTSTRWVGSIVWRGPSRPDRSSAFCTAGPRTLHRARPAETTCVEINQCVGCTSSLSHFSAMARPSWLGRAARNRHRHAIEQAPRRWRGGRREDSANAP